MAAAFGSDRVLVPRASAEWRTRLAQALDAIEGGDYRRGVAVLESAVDDRSGVVVRAPRRFDRSLPELRAALKALSGSTKKGKMALETRRFLSLEAYARGLLARLPEAAIAVYRQRLDDVGEDLFEKFTTKDDYSSLERLARTYFLTSWGDEARELLGDRFLEQGRYREAYLEYQSVLDDHPGTSVPLARLASKLLTSLRRLGDGELYSRARGDMLARAGAAENDGAFVTQLELLESTLPLVPVETRPAPRGASVWGGELRPSLLPELPGERLELSWNSWGWSEGGSVLPARPRGRRVRPPRRVGRPVKNYRTLGMDYPFVPLVAGDSVWMSGVFDTYEVDRRRGTGSVLQSVAKPVPLFLRSRYHFKERSDSPIYCMTLWKRAWDSKSTLQLPRDFPDEVLFAHYVSDLVRPQKFMGYEVNEELPIRSLVAYDAVDGRLLWRTLPIGPGAGKGGVAAVPKSFQPTRGSEAFAPVEIPADISYTSPVVVKGGVVFAGGWSEQGFVNAVVRALDLASGKTLWETLVSSSQMEQTMFGEIAREPFASFLVESEGVLYFQTNLGVVAALRPRTGEILWVTTYDTIPVVPTVGPIADRRQLTWATNPPYLMGHVLLVTPRDSNFLYAVDTGTGPGGEVAGGRILWHFDNSKGDLRDLLGCHGERLYFTGPAGVAYLDLRGLPSANDSLSRRAPSQKASPAKSRSPRRKLEAGQTLRNRIAARGVLTRSGVVFADDENLWHVDLDLGNRRPLTAGGFPDSLHGKYPGRVTVAGDLVLMTSNELLSAFAERTVADREGDY